MKTALALVAIVFASQAHALTCEGTLNKDTLVGLDQVKITADVQGDKLVNVQAYASDSNMINATNSEGEAAELPPTPYKRVSKYSTDYNRYDLTKLQDKKNNQFYQPGSDCYLNLMILKTIPAQTKFDAPLTVQCEQSGGTIHLTCQN